MFDTIQLKVRPVYIDTDTLNQHSPKSTTFLNTETGVLNTKYVIHDEQLPFITYQDSSQTLCVQVSIPNFLYGNNVTLLSESDIPLFFKGLQARLQFLFSIRIPDSDWTITRCDICWNFEVGKNAGEYVRLLGKQHFSFKDTIHYNQDETVVFGNKSSRIMFYDKHQQSLRVKHPSDIIEQAKGILRLEIKPSDHDMKKFSPTRKAIELLNKPFFDYMMGKTLEEIEYPSEASGISLSWLTENKDKISTIESLLGFQMLQNMFGEPTIKKLYTSSTYANRKSMTKKMTIPKGNCLEPLAIKPIEYIRTDGHVILPITI